MPLIPSNADKKERKLESNNIISKENIEPNKSGFNSTKVQKLDFKITDPMYSLKDMILPEKVREKIEDVIYSRHYTKKIFDEWGLAEVLPEFKNKVAVNLYGEPGTGKTMAAHAIAKELGKKLLKINYAEIESKYVGETAKNLENAFRQAKEKEAILFFDEADALLSRRVTNMNNSTDVSVNQTRSVLLMLMNSYDDIVLFTTNFINNFDEAFMRRIQFHIKFNLPTKEIRKELWNKYIPHKMPNDADIENLSSSYENISGSDIANSIMIASFKAARNRDILVKNEYFEEAIESIIKSKNDNKYLNNFNIEKRQVTEEYVKKQINL